MQPEAARTTVISGAALGAALVWGAVECLALLWSRLRERFYTAASAR